MRSQTSKSWLFGLPGLLKTVIGPKGPQYSTKLGRFDLAQGMQFKAIAPCCIGVIWSIFMLGCIVPPPIEPELAEINQPPRIDLTSPSVIQTINDPTPILLSGRPLDANEETQLYYAWIGRNTDRTLATVGRTTDQELVDGIFFVYETIELDVNPCGRDLRDQTNETIWLYVSDRPISVRSDTDVRTETGGFLVSHSWTFDIRPGACDGF